ncbi:MAG: hypothetical protein KIS84_13395 [Dokdonella sp.]|nr:hypothetical protein [Dokdonella sp.]
MSTTTGTHEQFAHWPLQFWQLAHWTFAADCAALAGAQSNTAIAITAARYGIHQGTTLNTRSIRSMSFLRDQFVLVVFERRQFAQAADHRTLDVKCVHDAP